jgi:hypothetical protein
MKQNPSAALITRALLGILAQAQRDGAQTLVMAPGAAGGAFYRYNVQGTWYKSPDTPSLDWSVVVPELAGLAGIRDQAFPKQGIIYVAYSGVRLRWRLHMKSEHDECVFHNLGSDIV